MCVPHVSSSVVLTGLALTAGLCCSCKSHAVGDQRTTTVPVDRETPHDFSDNWGNGPGCTPKGEELSLEGTIVVRPFGKGADGALLKTNTDEWVVSYHAEGALLALRGKPTLARGRACEKQGAAVSGKHFDLTRLEPRSSP